MAAIKFNRYPVGPQPGRMRARVADYWRPFAGFDERSGMSYLAGAEGPLRDPAHCDHPAGFVGLIVDLPDAALKYASGGEYVAIACPYCGWVERWHIFCDFCGKRTEVVPACEDCLEQVRISAHEKWELDYLASLDAKLRGEDPAPVPNPYEE